MEKIIFLNPVSQRANQKTASHVDVAREDSAVKLTLATGLLLNHVFPQVDCTAETVGLDNEIAQPYSTETTPASHLTISKVFLVPLVDQSNERLLFRTLICNEPIDPFRFVCTSGLTLNSERALKQDSHWRLQDSFQATGPSQCYPFSL